MRGILIAACLLGACAVLAAGCDEEYNPKDKECGYAGNGCWDPEGTPPQPSCNSGYLCNIKRKGEPLSEGKCPSTHGVCEACGSVDTGCLPPAEGSTAGTCPSGSDLVCNAKRKNEPVGENVCASTYGMCEPAPDGGVTPTPDGPAPTPDGPAPTPDGPAPTPDGTTDGTPPTPDAAPSVG